MNVMNWEARLEDEEDWKTRYGTYPEGITCPSSGRNHSSRGEEGEWKERSDNWAALMAFASNIWVSNPPPPPEGEEIGYTYKVVAPLSTYS
jgi:hypothetical protein